MTDVDITRSPHHLYSSRSVMTSIQQIPRVRIVALVKMSKVQDQIIVNVISRIVKVSSTNYCGNPGRVLRRAK